MIRPVAVIVFLTLAIAAAERLVAQPAPQESPSTQALQDRVLLEVRMNLQCSADLITARARIAELEKKLAEK